MEVDGEGEVYDAATTEEAVIRSVDDACHSERSNISAYKRYLRIERG